MHIAREWGEEYRFNANIMTDFGSADNARREPGRYGLICKGRGIMVIEAPTGENDIAGTYGREQCLQPRKELV
jgi:hypothetical protein